MLSPLRGLSLSGSSHSHSATECTEFKVYVRHLTRVTALRVILAQMLNWVFAYYLKSPCDPAPGSANVTVTPKPRDIIVTQIICDTRDNPLLWNLTLPPHPEHLAQSAKVLLVYHLDIPPTTPALN